MAERSFTRDGDVFVRRPTTEEIAATTTGAATDEVFPRVDVYDRITVPMTTVLPEQGFYAARRAEVERIAAARPDRRLVGTGGWSGPAAGRDRRLVGIGGWSGSAASTTR